MPPREAVVQRNARGGKRAPGNSVDRYNLVLRAAQLRQVHSTRNNKRSAFSWQHAVTELQRSKSDIWVQATGEKKGSVRGMPDKIKTDVLEQLWRIVHGDDDVEEWATRFPAGDGGAGGAPGGAGAVAGAVDGRLTIRENVIYKNCKYRNSAYALLASLWFNYGRPPLDTAHFKNTIPNYSDEPVDFNHVTNAHGVWKGIDRLKEAR